MQQQGHHSLSRQHKIFTQPHRVRSMLHKISLFGLIGLGLSSCASNTTSIEKKATQNPTGVNLVEDKIVAFGYPSSQIEGTTTNDVIFAGEKYSYLISKNGLEFLNIITKFDTNNVHMDKNLAFVTAKNDGHFENTVEIAFVKLQEEITKEDLLFLLRNKAVECTSSNDVNLTALRYCFKLDIEGQVYPVANNVKDLKVDLSQFGQPFKMTISNARHSKKAHPLVLSSSAVQFDLTPFKFEKPKH